MRSDCSFYFPPGPGKKAWGVAATGLGHATIHAHHPYPPLRHPVDHMFSWEDGRILQSYQILYLSQGSGVFESAKTGTVPLNSGDLFILFPGEWHRYRPNAETGWTEDWIELTGDTVTRLQQSGIISPESPIFPVGISGEYRDLFDRCRALVLREHADFTAALGIQGLQLIAMATMSQSLTKRVDEETENRIAAAKALIGERVDQPLVMEALAEEVGMPYSTFRRAFKERTGLTAKQYQLQLRHRKAQDLLANTSLPLQEIAAALGFDSAFHLSADFKKRLGQSPHRWRATYRKSHQDQALSFPPKSSL